MGDNMDAKAIFNKALLMLDQGELARGEKLLREAVHNSEISGDIYTKGRATCCLGDLLHQLGNIGESEAYLTAFLGSDRHDDVLDVERAHSEEILAAIRKDRGY
jgi:hypothetical protein